MGVKLKRVVITLCEECLKGVGDECHTPGCALFLHRAPDHEVTEELYEILDEIEYGEDET